MSDDDLQKHARERDALHHGQKSTRFLGKKGNTTYCGQKGEALFCEMFQVKHDMKLRRQGNRGYAYKLTWALCPMCKKPNCIHGRPSYKARIRTQRGGISEWLIEHKTREEHDADLFVLAHYNENRDRTRLIAWIWLDEVEKFPHSVFPLDVDNHTFKRGATHSIDSLLGLCGLPSLQEQAMLRQGQMKLL